MAVLRLSYKCTDIVYNTVTMSALNSYSLLLRLQCSCTAGV